MIFDATEGMETLGNRWNLALPPLWSPTLVEIETDWKIFFAAVWLIDCLIDNDCFGEIAYNPGMVACGDIAVSKVKR